MIEVLFSLKFHSQLGRTREAVLRSLQTSFVAAIAESGGQPFHDSKSFTALYDEDSFAFPLFLICAVEDLYHALEQVAVELYGHALVIKDSTIPLEPVMLRTLINSASGPGIWCDQRVRQMMEPFASYHDAPVLGYNELKALTPGNSKNSLVPFPGAIEWPERSCAIVMEGGENPSPALRSLYHRSTSLTPIIVIFGCGGTGLACICDGIGPKLLETLYPDGATVPAEAFKGLQRHRLRETAPGACTDGMESLFLDILDRYGAYAKAHGLRGVVAFDHIERADGPVRDMVFRLYERYFDYAELAVFISSSDEQLLPLPLPGNSVLCLPAVSSALDFPGLTGAFKELLYAIETALPCFPVWEIPSLLSEERRSSGCVRRALGMLAGQGLIISMDRPLPIQTSREDRSLLPEDTMVEMVRSFLRRRLRAHVEEGRLAPTLKLLAFLHGLGCDCGDDLVLDSLEQDIRYGFFKGIEDAMESGEFADLVGLPRAECLRLLVPASVALQHGNMSAVVSAFSVPPPDSYPSSRYEAYMLCDRAAYHLGAGNRQSAQTAAKRALQCLQDLPNHSGLCRTYRLIGLSQITQHRIGDGIEYLSFALDLAENKGDLYENALCSLFMAGAQFLTGNYSKAERYAKRAEFLSHKANLPAWAHRGHFFRGRLLFETGRYRDAAVIFDSVGGPLGDLWNRRCRAYEGFAPHTVSNIPPTTLEETLFTVEAAFLADRNEEVIALTDPTAIPIRERSFWFVEQADSGSGFAHCEEIAFPEGDFIMRQLELFRALALGNGAGRSKEQLKEAQNLLHRMFKEAIIPGADPYDVFYYYAQYRFLRDTGAAELDISTALSVAFKRLQRRAGRTDEIETRRSFLFRNRWNADLMRAAKAHNLI